MPKFKTDPATIASWLGSKFEGADVETVDLPQRMVFLFRVFDRERSPFPELAISWEALEDWEPNVIIGDLEIHHLPQHLAASPGRRVLYSRLRTIVPYPSDAEGTS